MKLRLILPMLLIVGSLHAQVDSTFIRRADSVARQGKLEEVVRLLDDQIRAHSSVATYYVMRGKLRLAMGKYDDAAADFQTGIKVDKNCAACRIGLSGIEATAGRLQSALQLADEGIGLDPASAFAYQVRGQVREALGMSEDALADYNRSIEMDPKNPAPYLARGAYRLARRDLERALEDFTLVVRTTPSEPFPYFQRAHCFVEMRRFEDAYADLTRAIELGYVLPDLLITRGAVLDRMRRPVDALADYDRAVALDSTSFGAYYNRALSHYALEDMDASCSDATRALALGRAQGRSGGEMDELKRTIADICMPTAVSYFYHRGIAEYNKRNFKGAVESYNAGLNVFPGNMMLTLFRGNAYMQLGEYQAAARDYRMILDSIDRSVDEMVESKRRTGTSVNPAVLRSQLMSTAHEGLSQGMFALGNYEGALGEIDSAIDVVSAAAGPISLLYNSRGLILLALARHAEALEDFTKTTLMERGYAPAFANRAIAHLNLALETPIRLAPIDLAARKEGLPPVGYTFPSDPEIAGETEEVTQALQAIDRALEINPDMGHLYPIRGLARMLLERENYCDDFRKGKELGDANAASMAAEYCR